MTTALAQLEELAVLDDSLRNLSAIELKLERDMMRRSLFEFLKAVWPIVEPSQPFTSNWHVEEMCKVLEGITFARNGSLEKTRYIFNIPPGTLKSLLISVIWPAWVWARNPKKRFLTAAYASSLTIRDNLRVRDIIESRWFQERFPMQLVEDQNTKTRYNNDSGGWRIATGVEGTGTGEHPDYIIIDDPTSAAQAMSAVERQVANDWFDRTISSRGMTRNVVVIVVMQRLHEDDLTGHLLARGGAEHICFPMRYEKCTCPGGDPFKLAEDQRCAPHKARLSWRPDPRDPRTSPGELLFPALFPEHKIKQLELDLGPYGASGQLQQRPSPEGGGLFKREWFKFADKAPTLARRVRGWDTAGTEDGGDYTVGIKVSEEFAWVQGEGTKKTLESTGRFFIEDVQRDQLGPDGVDKLIKVTAELDGKSIPVREEKEGGAAGKTVILARTKMLKGWDYEGVSLGGSKITRAKPFRSQCEGGNVYLVRAPWNEAYIQELCAFPTANHDDQVDASSCAFNAVLLEEPPRKVEVSW
jgi:predicted phage terminase large subunit-like protein